MKHVLQWTSAVAALAATFLLSSCVTYLTPGAGAPMRAITSDGPSSAAKRLPDAQFPARLSIARLQAAGYRSFGAEGFGDGDYSVIFAREVETADDFNALRDWPQVLGVAPLSRLLLPAALNSFDDLRMAAAEAQTDVLFVYTFDTTFHIENRAFRPEELITLGVLPGREASVSSTAAGMFIDVRTGFIYGSAEGSAVERTLMTKWTKPSFADDTRLKAERTAFKAMMADAQGSWDRVVARYAPSLTVSPDGSTELPYATPLSEEALPPSASAAESTADASR
jgi:hypothetical protein